MSLLSCIRQLCACVSKKSDTEGGGGGGGGSGQPLNPCMHIVIHDDDTIVQGDGNNVQGGNGKNEVYRVKGARRRQRRRKKKRERQKQTKKKEKKKETAKLLDSNQ